MANANVEQIQGQEGREKTPAEKSAELVSSVEGRFIGTNAKIALQEARKEPGAQDADRDLSEKIKGLAQSENTLREIMEKGKYDNLSIPDKVAFTQALDKAKFYAMHAFSEPADLERIQSQWENAVDNFKNRTIGLVERTRAVLSGEMGSEDIAELNKKFKISSDETLKLREYLAQAPHLTPDDKARLLSDLASKIEDLHAAEGDFSEIAAQKRLPDQEKDQRLRAYKSTADNYERSRQSLYDFLKQVEDYGPKK